MVKSTSLSPCGLGVTFGLFFGVDLFLHALFAMQGWSWWFWNPGTWNLYTQAFPWLEASMASALWGLIMGFVCGFVCGQIFARIYNKINSTHKCRLC